MSANVIQANKTYPPPNGSFRAAGPAYNFGSGGSAVQFKDVAFTFFDSFTLIGAPGGSVTFNAQFSHKLSTDGGATWSGEQAATAAFSITLGAVSGNDHSFTINSLTISGGDLPANFQLRKLAVVGTPVATFTPNTPSAGLFTIDNSFYLSLELSQDSGGTWAANTTSGSFGTPSYVLAPLSNEEVTRSPTLPPGDGQYYDPDQYHAAFANGIVVRNPIHNGFIGQSCTDTNGGTGTPSPTNTLCPPPILGQTQTEDFTSKMRFDIEMPGLVHVGPIDATVQTRVQHSHDSGVIEIYRTRMLQLDPTPGTLPPGMNFRINPDPNKPSLGMTTLRPGPTPDTTNISSSFALRLQMTTDGGATWEDADQFARMQLQILPTITNSIAVVAGFNLITLQLDNTNGLNALETPEDGDQVYRWNVAAQDFDGSIPTYFSGFGWTPEFFPAPGEAFFYVTATPRTLSYTGGVHLPVLPLLLPPNAYSAVGRQTNGPGTYENIVGQPPGVGAQFNRWNAATQEFITNTFNGTTWSGGVPSANLGEGVFIYPTVLRDRTWNGLGTNNLFTTASNWNAAVAAGDSLIFDGTTRLNPFNDFPAGTGFRDITFNSGAGAFVITGNWVTLTGNITNNQPNGVQTMGMPITCTDTRFIHVVSNGTLLVSAPMSGSFALNKAGSGRVILRGTNTFTGAVNVAQGTLRVDNDAALGATNGPTVVSSGATLDVGASPTGVNGLDLGQEQVFVNGHGVTDNGVIVSAFGNAQINALRRVILTGDSSFGGTGPWTSVVGAANPGRWDIRGTPSTASLSTGGQPYTLTKVGSNEVRLAGVWVDPALGNIDIQQGALGIEGTTTSLGNPASTLTVHPGATFELVTPTNRLNKVFVLIGDGVTDSVHNRSGNNTVSGPITLINTCLFNVGGTALTNRGPIGGSGGMTKVGAGSLVLASNNTYTGNTTINAGVLALLDNGSIPNSPNIILADGATLDVSGRADGMLRLEAGQTLSGDGTIIGSVTNRGLAHIMAGTSNSVGTLNVIGNVWTGGGYTTLVPVNHLTNGVLDAVHIDYAGTLLLFQTSADEWEDRRRLKPFNAATYTGAFSEIMVQPPLPADLVLDTSMLTIDGSITIVAAPQLVFSGLPNAPLGNASLVTISNRLVVSNLGTQGADGVTIAIPNSGGLNLHWMAPDLVLEGHHLAVTTRGVVNGATNQPLSVATATRVGDVVQLAASFPAIPVAGGLIELFLGGRLVAVYDRGSNPVVQALPTQGGGPRAPCDHHTYIHWESDPIWVETIWSYQDIMFAGTGGPCDPFPIVVNDAPPVLADAIHFISASASNLIQGVESVEITCQGPPLLEIDAEALQVFRMPNVVVGQGQLQAQNLGRGAKLCIGTQGADGLVIHLDQPPGFGMGVNATSLWGHAGTSLQNVSSGQSGAGTEQTLGVAVVHGTSTGLALNVTFAALGATSQVVKFYDVSNNLIRAEEMLDNGTVFIGGPGPGLFNCLSNATPQLSGGWVMSAASGRGQVWQSTWDGACNPILAWTASNPSLAVAAHGISVEPRPVPTNVIALNSVALSASNLSEFTVVWEGEEPPYVVEATPHLSMQRSNSTLHLAFEGTLQSASNPAGPWTNIGTNGSLSLQTTGAMQFLRAASDLVPWGGLRGPNPVWGVTEGSRITSIDPATGRPTGPGQFPGHLMLYGGNQIVSIPTGVAKHPTLEHHFMVSAIGRFGCDLNTGTGFFNVDERTGTAWRLGFLAGREIKDIEYNPKDGILYGFEGDTLVKITSLGAACVLEPYGTLPTVISIGVPSAAGIGPYSVAFDDLGQCNIISARDRKRAIVDHTSALLPVLGMSSQSPPGMVNYQELAFCISMRTLMIGTIDRRPVNLTTVDDYSFYYLTPSSWVEKGDNCAEDYTAKPEDPNPVFYRKIR